MSLLPRVLFVGALLLAVGGVPAARAQIEAKRKLQLEHDLDRRLADAMLAVQVEKENLNAAKKAYEARENKSNLRKKERAADESTKADGDFLSIIERVLKPMKSEIEKLHRERDVVYARMERAKGSALDQLQKKSDDISARKDSLEAVSIEYGNLKDGLTKGSGPESKVPTAMIGQACPNITLKQFNGETFKPSDHRDKAVVIVVFSVYNKGSVDYFASMAKNLATRKPDDVKFFAVAVGGDPKEVQTALDAIDPALLKGAVAHDPDSKVASQLKAVFVPQTIVLNHFGTVHNVFIGATNRTRPAVDLSIENVLAYRESERKGNER